MEKESKNCKTTFYSLTKRNEKFLNDMGKNEKPKSIYIIFVSLMESQLYFSQKVLCTPLTQFPFPLILSFYMTVVHLSQLRN